jgi:hypothetical protein
MHPARCTAKKILRNEIDQTRHRSDKAPPLHALDEPPSKPRLHRHLGYSYIIRTALVHRQDSSRSRAFIPSKREILVKVLDDTLCRSYTIYHSYLPTICCMVFWNVAVVILLNEVSSLQSGLPIFCSIGNPNKAKLVKSPNSFISEV